ncbi:hypothetical protein SLS60_011921 [Paraconiothyrium brasiliense]|uniref:ABC transporter n=1 Tax=Paraconiothyrium brasiliense TaxID=300254 RepID=A0ABR3QH89_9PLEO
MPFSHGTFLDYTYSPTIVLGYFLALIYGLCTLEKVVVFPPKKRLLPALSMLLIALSYIFEALLHDRSASRYALLRIATVTPVWIALAVHLYKAEYLLWNPYIGVFFLGLLFEVVTTALLRPTSRSSDIFSLCLSIFRAVVTLALSTIGIFYQAERHSDEEGQMLLGNGNGNTPQQQHKRLREPCNWIEYLQGFAIFMPYLLPWHDSKVHGYLALRLVIALLRRGSNVATPWAWGRAIDKLNLETTMPWKEIGIWTACLWIDGRAGLDVFDQLASSCIQNSSFKKVVELAMGHVMRLSFEFHSTKNTGEILKAIDQAGSLNSLAELLIFQILPVVLDLIIAMIYVNHLIGMYLTLCILGITATYVPFVTTLNLWIQPKHRIFVESCRNEARVANEMVSNWIIITLFGRTGHEMRCYLTVVQDFVNASYDYLYRMLLASAVQDLIMNAGLVGCAILAMLQVVTGAVSLGAFLNFAMYWNAIKGTIRQLTNSYDKISSTFVNAEALLELLYTEPSVPEPELSKKLAIDTGEVRFENVSFAYRSGKRVIENIDFSAKAGTTTAIVGESGSGKSTILALILRLHDVCEGSITIDGQDVREVDGNSLHTAIGVVPQKSDLFNRSIMDNVRYGNLDATDEEVINVCKAAAMHECIMSFPDGYGSTVGERGVLLSGGQSQRLSIARVLLKNPKIILLDEATSSVDTLTEKSLQEAFSYLTPDRTKIVIAHRLSTIVQADTILVVHEGKIVESGTHEELLAKGGRYNKLWTQQTLKQ